MTVSELNLATKSTLETYFSDISLTGELSRITKHASGHWYFDLKDKRAAISCVMFARANQKLDFSPNLGDLLELFGSVSLFEASGRYQFMATSMKKAGQGELEKRFLELKAKLESLGLFDKQNLPKPNPSRVGLICSPTSAALGDIKRMIITRGNFLCSFLIFPALTQGSTAPKSLIKALKKADSLGLDALILARGGGSREDLFCFNDEELARVIFDLQTPIISAIGHEIDYVISDFVADLRAPTPTAAVSLLLPSKDELELELDMLFSKLYDVINQRLSSYEQALFRAKELFSQSSLPLMINLKAQSLKELELKLNQSINSRLFKEEARLEKFESLLESGGNFLQKSAKLFSVKVDGHVVCPDDLMAGMDVELASLKRGFRARLLGEI